MEEIMSRVWHNIIDRMEGPMHFRFYIQPLVSLIFALIAAFRDAKSGAVPYLWKFAYAKKGNRRNIAKEAWTDVGKVFLTGVTLDIVYQLLIIYKLQTKSWFYPVESLIVAFILAIVPYLLIRGPVNRLVTMFIRKVDEPEIENRTTPKN